jgi:hypothetical protein
MTTLTNPPLGPLLDRLFEQVGRLRRGRRIDRGWLSSQGPFPIQGQGGRNP